MHALRLLLLVLTIAGLAAPSAARGAFNHAYTTDGSLQSRENVHSGLTLSFDPDALGRPRAARPGTTTYISGGSYHANGLIADATYLNGQSLAQTLNARQLPDVLKTTKAGGANAVWLSYLYDSRRKIASVADLDGVGGNESRTYTYDANGRLLTASGPWGTNGAQAAGSFKYDALGNIREQKLGTRTIAIAYDAAKNRVLSANNGGTVRNYAYDARGNATGVAGFTFTYDFANQPTAVSGGVAATYAYDGNLKRVKEVRGGKTVYTVYSRVTGGLVYRDEATDVVKTDYVTVGGAALRLKKTGTGAFVPEYTHFDAQGSAVAATNASGQVTWRERYAPYGEELLNPAANADNTGYTGHLKDDATGLNYMQARYYDPVIGRFLSTDPIGYQDQLNLYAYVANDPVNKTDPNGEESLCTTCGVGSPTSDKIGLFLAGLAPGAGVIEAVANGAGARGIAVAVAMEAPGLKQVDKAVDAAKALKTVKISASKSPEAAKHIKEAGVEGKKLTVDRAGAADRRAEALKGTETKPGMDRDEVPPAVFKEGGAGSSVRSIPSGDNRSAGAQLGNQLRDVPNGGCVKIEICE